MKDILINPYYASIAILVSQIIFLYLRTLNVIYTTDRKMVPAIITGAGIGISWLISTSIGISSVLDGHIVPIIAFIIGGAIGTYLGINNETKKANKNENN